MSRAHIYFAVDGIAFPIVEGATVTADGVLHAMDFGQTKPTRRKTRDVLCGKRLQVEPVTVPNGTELDVAMPWPPPARNPIGARCPGCFDAGHARRPDWTWRAWAGRLVAPGAAS